MTMSDFKTPRTADSSKILMDDIIDDLFHDAQNGIHRVGMELELASMGLGETDAEKTGELIKSLENHVRDLRGYISSIQNPAAACDVAAVLEGVVTNLKIDRRNPRALVRWIAPASLPLVAVHRKLLARVLERLLEFCDNLMREGGELRIAAGRRESLGKFQVEITLTLLAAAPLNVDADKELFGDSSNRIQTHSAKRAVEVLRRHHGETAFHKANDCQYEISLLLPAASVPGVSML
jgi:hypothetical protein